MPTAKGNKVKTVRAEFLERVRSVNTRRRQQLTLGGFWIMVRGRPVFVRSHSTPGSAVKSTTKAGKVRKAQAVKIKPKPKPTKVNRPGN